MTTTPATQRIAQFEKMTQADPENAMGWFSLGNAYKDAGRRDEAVSVLRRAIELDPGLSRAYQTLGQTLLALEQHEEAGQALTQGYRTAAEKGDVMPQRAMASLLTKLGLPVPVVESKAPTHAPSAPDGLTVIDRRSGVPGPRLAEAPMRGSVGEFILAHFSATTWNEWIRMGTKVINEMRLDFSHLEHQMTYEQQMLDWLGVSREEIDQWSARQG